MKKIRFLALSLVISASLCAAPDVELYNAVTRLQELALEVKEPETQKLIKEALKGAEGVLRSGDRASPEMAKKALIMVKKVSAVAHAHALGSHFHHKHPDHKYWSSSSSASCDMCHGIDEVASEVEKCCEDIKNRIEQIISTLASDVPCEAPFVIDAVPVELSESGKYCVTKDLLYDGTGAAITVTADNVTINFQNHSLTLNNSLAEGILVDDVSEFTLENDIITGSSVYQTDSSVAVHLVDVQKANLMNLYTKNTTKGIWIENSSDVQVSRCFLEAHEGSPYVSTPVKPAGVTNGAAIWISGSDGVSIDGSTFRALNVSEFPATRSSTACVIDDTSKNIAFTGSNFYDWLITMYAPSVEGLLIDGCQAIANNFSQLQLVQLGSCGEDGEANDIIIKNSIFKKDQPESSNFDGILLVSGRGCLLDSLILDVNSSNTDDYTVAALHIGVPDCTTYHNVLVKNCLFKGSVTTAVRILAGDAVLIEDSQITATDGLAVVITGGSEGCLVNNCVIHATLGSIILTPDTPNGFRNNQVYGADDGVGISVTGPVNVTNNSVYGNSTGIVTSGGIEEVYFNTSCHNFTVDCTNVATAQASGNVAMAGSTICCDFEEQ